MTRSIAGVDKRRRDALSKSRRRKSEAHDTTLPEEPIEGLLSTRSCHVGRQMFVLQCARGNAAHDFTFEPVYG